MEERQAKIRVQGLPKPQNPLLFVAIGLILIGALIQLFIPEKIGYSDFGVLLLTITGSVLLFLAQKQAELYILAGVALFFTVGSAFDAPFLYLAILLWTISVIGVFYNVDVKFLPQVVRIPVWNFVSIVLALIGLLMSFKEEWDSGREFAEILVLWLFLASSILLNLCVKAQPVNESVELQPRLKSIPIPTALFLAGGILIVVNGAWELIQWIRMRDVIDDGTSAFILNAIWLLPAIVAGVLLIMSRNRRKYVLPAVILLLVVELRSFLRVGRIVWLSQSTYIAQNILWLLIAGLAMMLIGTIGVTQNKICFARGEKQGIPVLNFGATVFFGIYIIWKFFITVFYEVGEGGAIDFPLVDFLMGILLPIGLILINLSTQIQPVSRKVKEKQYRQGKEAVHSGTGSVSLLQRFFSNVGGSLQLIAKIYAAIFLILGLLSAVCAVLGLLLMLLQIIGFLDPYGSWSMLVVSGLIGAVGCLILATGAWPLYAFGQITSDVHALREGGIPSRETVPAEEKAEPENPDELPEL